MGLKKQVSIISVIPDKMWEMFDIPIFGGSRSEVLKVLEKQIFTGYGDKEVMFVATVNSEFVMKAEKDRKFKILLQKRTSLNVCDGIGLVWAKEILNCKSETFLRRLWLGFWVGLGVLSGKYSDRIVAGSSLVKDICKLAAKKEIKVFFLGGWGDRSVGTAENLKSKIQNLKCEGCKGKPKFSDDEVLKKIRESKVKVLFVAYGMKKQEEWIDKNLKDLEKVGVRLVMGVGRSMDYYSGELKRAPKVVRKMGLEWLYSLYKEPKRWRRQLVLPKFIWKVLINY